MPIETIMIVGAIVLAFAAFAITLAWGEWSTRDIHRTGAKK